MPWKMGNLILTCCLAPDTWIKLFSFLLLSNLMTVSIELLARKSQNSLHNCQASIAWLFFYKMYVNAFQPINKH